MGIRDIFKHECRPSRFTWEEGNARYAECERCLQPVLVREGEHERVEDLKRNARMSALAHPTYKEGVKQPYNDKTVAKRIEQKTYGVTKIKGVKRA